MSLDGPSHAEQAPPIDSVAMLLAHAHTMEADAVERYETLAGQMEVHHNPELAEFFHKMAAIEAKHVVKVDDMAEELELPAIKPWDYRWLGSEGPESTPFDRTHYRMTPYHALRLAMENEQRAVAFFEDVARRTNDDAVRVMAEDLAEDERHHVSLLLDWLARYPEPSPGWDADMDDPVSQE